MQDKTKKDLPYFRLIFFIFRLSQALETTLNKRDLLTAQEQSLDQNLSGIRKEKADSQDNDALRLPKALSPTEGARGKQEKGGRRNRKKEIERGIGRVRGMDIHS